MAMNNKRVFYAVFAFSTLFLVACGSTLPTLKPYHVEVQQGNVVDEKMMAQLHQGMTKSQVRYILGTPLIQDSFHQNRWDYFYQIRKEGKINDQRRVILDFENDALKNIRGDVVPAGSAAVSEDAGMATLSAGTKPASQQAEDKSLWDRLKLWGDDEKPATKAAPKPAVESKPEESKKSIWNRLKFWEDSDKPAPKTDKSSEATTVMMKKIALSHQMLELSPFASEVADVAQQKQEVTAAVLAWADAWRNKDVKSYLAAYADQFVPEGSSNKKAWAKQRKQRISQAKDIKLTLGNLNVELVGQLATVTFDQNYSTSKFSDHVAKTLQLTYSENQWLIVKEFNHDAGSRPVSKSTYEAPVFLSVEESVPAEPNAVEVMTSAQSVNTKPQDEVVKPEVTAPEVTKPQNTKSESKSGNNEPSIFERMLEKIGF
jgi:outer membrane protein assembly factor BamE